MVIGVANLRQRQQKHRFVSYIRDHKLMMDVSSLPEAQQQNQDYASQSYYDQTQIQSYDQSYYYYYHHQQQQQQHHAYYQQSYYSTAYQSLPHQQYPETSTLNPPGVSVSANEAAEIAGPGGAQQARQQYSAYYPGLNPAAAAALSQLAQFAGTMQAAEGAMGGMHTPVGGLLGIFYDTLP